MQDVVGKVAFITGGASGVGFALAVTFAQVGMKIVLADMRPEPLARAEAHLQRSGAQVLALPLDVTDRKA